MTLIVLCNAPSGFHHASVIVSSGQQILGRARVSTRGAFLAKEFAQFCAKSANSALSCAAEINGD